MNQIILKQSDLEKRGCKVAFKSETLSPDEDAEVSFKPITRLHYREVTFPDGHVHKFNVCDNPDEMWTCFDSLGVARQQLEPRLEKLGIVPRFML